MTGAGRTVVEGGVHMIGPYSATLDGHTLVNVGEGSFSGITLWFQNGGVFINGAGATFDIQTDGYLGSDGNHNVFENRGMLRKSGGTGEWAVAPGFRNNRGTVEVASGTLSLAGGGSSSGASAIAAGTVRITGGTFDLEEAATITGSGLLSVQDGTLQATGNAEVGNVVLDGGTIDVEGNLIARGSLSWTAGTMTGAGRTAVEGGVHMSGPYSATLDGHTLVNAGEGSFSEITLWFQNGGVFANQTGATFDIQTDGYLGSDGSDNVFENGGKLLKSGGAYTTSIGVPMHNVGTIDARIGVLSISGALRIDNPGALAGEPAGTIAVAGDLIGDTLAADHFAHRGTVRLEGSLQLLEVMGDDGGPNPSVEDRLFLYDTLSLASGANVQLVDLSDNRLGAAPEALYARRIIVPSGATLDLNGFAAYALTADVQGTIRGGTIQQLQTRPHVVSHEPGPTTAPPLESIGLYFSHAMDPGSFSLDDDLLRFRGPDGPLTVIDATWINPKTLRFGFEPQTRLGTYELVIGPNIHDLAGCPLDQDLDFVPGEVWDDRYVAKVLLTGPKVIETVPGKTITQPFESVRIVFDRPMDTSSFSLADDVDLLGPGGPIAINSHDWIDSRTLEVYFAEQSTLGAYSFRLGPMIADQLGYLMDQDGDFVGGEIPDDEFRLDFQLLDYVTWSGDVTEDATWSGVILLAGSVQVSPGVTLTVAPGTILKFDGGRLYVQGTMQVSGTASHPVFMTSAADDTVGGDTNDNGDITSAAPGDWVGIIVQDTASAVFRNFEIRYATTAIDANYQGAQVKLSSGILRDSSQYGIYVYAPYVDVDADNVVIANSGWNGIFMRASSRGTFTNCTIVGNGVETPSFENAGVHIGAATMVFDSCIVAFNANGIDHTDADPSETIVRHSLFYNPAGQNIVWTADGPEPRLDQNGNMVADPLFVDRAAGNYELAAFSPAIDAGRAIGAPPTDLFGRPRFDDRGLENRGSGNPSYVDIGAYERQQSSLPYADLTLVGVSASPLDLAVGKTITVTWTVENTGQRDVTTAWVDAVYLSSDPHLSTVTDRLLAEIPRTEGLATGARYTQTWTGSIPADLAGPQYVIVRANSGSAFRESTSLNNTRIFDQVVAVAVPALTTDAPQTGHVARGEWVYYRYDVEPGRSVLFELDSVVSTGTVHLYLRRGGVPTVSNYHLTAATFNRPDQQLRLLEPSAGVYYIGVYGQSLGAGGTNFTLTAQTTDLAIRQITPGRVGNAGPVTVEIVGDNFSRGAVVTLVGPGGVTVIEGQEWFQDASTLYATFDLAAAGAAPGVYSVVVALPEIASVTKFSALTVQAGGAAALTTNLTVPGLARPAREIQVTVQYTNTGTIDLPSPLLTLESTGTVAWRRLEPQLQPAGGQTAWARRAVHDISMIRPSLIDPRWLERVSVTVLGLSTTGPAAALRPGQTETLTLTVRTPFAAGNVPFTLYAFGTPGDPKLNDPLDWAQLGADLRPIDLPADAWDPLLARLQAQVGTTWDDYLGVLRDNANHLAEIGQRVYDHGDLFAFEFVQAAMMGTPPFMEAARDAFAPAPGLPLSFERHFLPEPLRRARLGPLGRGWMHTYQITLYGRSDGSVAIHGPSTGFDRSFQPDGSGGYLAAGNATLTPLGDGEFLLTEPSGLKYLFRSDGRWTWIEEPNGNRQTTSYDTQGRLVRVTHSDGDRFLFEYNAAGRLVKQIDHADRATHYTYDASGEHLLSVIGPDGESTAYTYQAGAGPLLDHHLTSITRPGGLQLQFSYDALGRLAGHHVAAGEESISYTYSTAGKTAVSDVFGNTTTYWLDSRGQTAMIEDPLGERYYLTYGATGDLTGIFGPDALAVQLFYDAAGNVVALRDPMGHETTFGYGGPFDNITLVRDARGNAIRYAYDVHGNLSRITYEDGAHEDFQYDGTGNLLAWTNRRGATITYAYNARGQLTGKNDPDTPGVTDFLYTYDTAGRLTSASGPEGITAFTYHPQTGRLTRIDYPSIGGKAIHLTFEYDAAGRRTKSIDQEGHVLNYFYDAAGRLDWMTDAASELVVDYEYDVAGRLIRKTLGNGVYTTYDHDAAWQLVSLVNHQPGGTVLSRFDYTYDALGRRVAMDTHYGRWTYGYDATGQLTRAVLVSTDPDIPDQDLTYVYDAVGNRIRTIINGELTEYTTNNMNQYVQVGDRAYVFDADGNLVQETGPDGMVIYTYNDENRLVAVTRGDDVWRYTFDALGNRVAVDDNGAVTRYVIDPIGFGNVVGEYDDAGNSITRYDYGYGLLSRTGTPGIRVYYTFDAVGNTTELLGMYGIVHNSYAYLPFGEAIRNVTGIANHFQFVGEWGVMADVGGLNHMRARPFDPRIGRFMEMDPIGLAGGDVNLYRYTLNEPVSLVDPTGEAIPLVVAYLLYEGSTVAAGVLGAAHSIFVDATGPTGVDYFTDFRSRLPEIGVRLLAGACAGLLARDWTSAYLGGMLASEIVGNTVNITEFVEKATTEALIGMEKISDTIGNIVNDLAKDMSSIIWRIVLDVAASFTPEDKFGPAGYDDAEVEPGDEQRFILPGQVMHYRIDFWNDEDALVPTQDAVIFDWLDPTVFDVSTFEFTRIGFLDWDMPLAGGQAIDVRIDARPEMNIAVEVRAGWEMNVQRSDGQMVLVDPDGKLVWWFHTIDPETGDYPDDPMAGFLPAFNPETQFELGWIEFRVKAWDDLPTGTRIENRAYVQFDFMANPKTGLEWGLAPPGGPWVNTIDVESPESWVEPLAAVVNTPEFLVTWNGIDNEGGSGIARYDIYVSTDGGPFTRWLADVAENAAMFIGEAGRTYAFYSVATDNVGQREAGKTIPDTIAYVTIPPAITALTANPSLVLRPANITLTATGVGDSDGSVERVEFYRGDVWLGTDENGNDGWSWTGSTADWAPGEHAFFARARDNDGTWSEPATVSATVTSWQNLVSPYDVNADGTIEPMDALLLINEINRHGARNLPPRFADDLQLPYFDVSGDARLDALDVLLVINFINLRSSHQYSPAGSGEGEQAASWVNGGRVPLVAAVSTFDRTQLLWRRDSCDVARRLPFAFAAAVHSLFDSSDSRNLEPLDRKILLDWDVLLGEAMPDLADWDAYFSALD